MATNVDRSGDTEDKPSCWICQEEGADDSGQPLQRDCSCRGSDSGFVHLSCLVEYSKHKTIQWNGRNFVKLKKLWEDCPCCKQPFQNELRIRVATEFVSFVETNYSNDQGMLVTALHQKMVSLTHMVYFNRCTPQARQEIKDIANEIFSVFKQIKTEEYQLLNRVQYMEADTYNCLGRIAMYEETKEGAQEALAHFEKCRDVGILLRGSNTLLATTEHNITIAMEKCEKSSMSTEKIVEQSQKLYDLRIKLYGEGAINTLSFGTSRLARDLMKADRLIEAESLLLNLATVSKRVHGLDHSVTKKIQSEQRDLKEHQIQQLKAQRTKQLNLLLATLASVFFLWHLDFILNIEELPKQYYLIIFLSLVKTILYF